MRLLLDTNIFVWTLESPERVESMLSVFGGSATELLVSAVVPWELSIKFALGRLELPEPPATYVPSRMRALAATAVPITQEHALGVASLPPIHGDPFDRLLVAQALALDATLVTGDATVERYPAPTLLV